MGCHRYDYNVLHLKLPNGDCAHSHIPNTWIQSFYVMLTYIFYISQHAHAVILL